MLENAGDEAMKEIKEGCLAISINCLIPENNGICVVVGKHLIESSGFHSIVNCWEVEHEFVTVFGERVNFIPNKQLMRIDGGNFKEECEVNEYEKINN
jgi:hypothetical protein